MAGGKIEAPAISAEEFVPEPVDDDDGFWSDDGKDKKDDKKDKKKKESVRHWIL